MNNTVSIKIVAFGDSITEGTWGGADVSQTYPVILKHQLDSVGIKCNILNMGIAGETSAEGLHRFERAVLIHNPDYVLIMYGANDAFVPWGFSEPAVSLSDYESNLRKMIALSLGNGIIPVLMTPTPLSPEILFESPVENFNDPADMLKPYVEKVIHLAAAENVLLVDHYNLWQARDAEHGIIKKYLPDGVHPNATGNDLIANTIFEVVFEDINNQ